MNDLGDLGDLGELVAALADALDPTAEIRYRAVLCREAYARGRADGWRQGYEEAGRDMDRRWAEITRPVTGPAHAEMEWRRWGPGGRSRFGDPRPGDYAPRQEAAA